MVYSRKSVEPVFTKLWRVPAGTWTRRPGADPGLVALQDRGSFARYEDEDLIDVGVRLFADLTARRDVHDHDLAMLGQ